MHCTASMFFSFFCCLFRDASPTSSLFCRSCTLLLSVSAPCTHSPLRDNAFRHTHTHTHSTITSTRSTSSGSRSFCSSSFLFRPPSPPAPPPTPSLRSHTAPTRTHAVVDPRPAASLPLSSSRQCWLARPSPPPRFSTTSSTRGCPASSPLLPPVCTCSLLSDRTGDLNLIAREVLTQLSSVFHTYTHTHKHPHAASEL